LVLSSEKASVPNEAEHVLKNGTALEGEALIAMTQHST
jgi:hypothetical protein